MSRNPCTQYSKRVRHEIPGVVAVLCECMGGYTKGDVPCKGLRVLFVCHLALLFKKLIVEKKKSFLIPMMRPMRLEHSLLQKFNSTFSVALWVKEFLRVSFLQCLQTQQHCFIKYNIDVIHKWLPINYSFVLVQISLPSLTVMC